MRLKEVPKYEASV